MGFRIELGEIESTLMEHPDVRQCVVLAREESSGVQQLVACLVTAGSLSTLSLRRFLRQELPVYMIPSHFVMLTELPKTSSGKVDRKALLRLEAARSTDKAQVAPRTETEKLIAEIFCSVLRLKKVSVHDNFFDLGGHSLQSLQVVAEIEKKADVEILPYSLFQETLGQLAETVDKARG